MVRKELFSTGPAEASVRSLRGDPVWESARPSPEQGHRLMRAFLSIKEAALREAIVNFVTDVSTLRNEGS